MRIDGMNTMDVMAGAQKVASQQNAQRAASQQNPQKASGSQVDVESKNLKNQISQAEQKKRELSSKDDMSVREKNQKESKLQQEISGLTVQLRQRKTDVRREEQKDARAVEADKEKEKAAQQKKEERQMRTAENRGTEENGRNAQLQRNGAENAGNAGNAAETKNPGVQAAGKSDANRMGVQNASPTSQNNNQGTAVENRTSKITGNNAPAKDQESQFTITEKSRKEQIEEDRKNMQERMQNGISAEEMQGLTQADSVAKQVQQNGTVINRMEDGLVILKREAQLDENRGVDTTRKQDEIRRQEEKLQRARENMASPADDRNRNVGVVGRSRENNRDTNWARAEARSANARERNVSIQAPNIPGARENGTNIQANNLPRNRTQAAQQQVFASVGITNNG